MPMRPRSSDVHSAPFEPSWFKKTFCFENSRRIFVGAQYEERCIDRDDLARVKFLLSSVRTENVKKACLRDMGYFSSLASESPRA